MKLFLSVFSITFASAILISPTLAIPLRTNQNENFNLEGTWILRTRMMGSYFTDNKLMNKCKVLEPVVIHNETFTKQGLNYITDKKDPLNQIIMKVSGNSLTGKSALGVETWLGHFSKKVCPNVNGGGEFTVIYGTRTCGTGESLVQVDFTMTKLDKLNNSKPDSTDDITALHNVTHAKWSNNQTNAEAALAQYVNEVIWQESRDINLSQTGGGPGRGYFQYGVDGSSETAVNRALKWFDARKLKPPEWLSKLDGKEKLDFSTLSQSQQVALFLYDTFENPKANLNDLITAYGTPNWEQVVEQTWRKSHNTHPSGDNQWVGYGGNCGGI